MTQFNILYLPHSKLEQILMTAKKYGLTGVFRRERDGHLVKRSVINQCAVTLYNQIKFDLIVWFYRLII